MKTDLSSAPIDPEDEEVAAEVQRHFSDSVRKAYDRLEREVFFGDGGNTCSSNGPAIHPEALTVQKLMDTYNSMAAEVDRFSPNQGTRCAGRSMLFNETIDHISEMGWSILTSYERPSSLGMPLPCPTNAFGIPVHTSRYLGDTVYPVAPTMKKGPYLQRRIKRWYRAHPGYTVGNGTYLIVEGREIWCHPDDLAKLIQAVNEVRPADTKEDSNV